jgi:hypothetical protein
MKTICSSLQNAGVFAMGHWIKRALPSGTKAMSQAQGFDERQ